MSTNDEGLKMQITTQNDEIIRKFLKKKTGNTGPGPLTSHVCGVGSRGVQHIFWTRHVTS